MAYDPGLAFDYAAINALLEAQLNAYMDRFLKEAIFMADPIEDRLCAFIVDPDDQIQAVSLRGEVLREVRRNAEQWRERGGASPTERREVRATRAVLAEWLAE